MLAEHFSLFVYSFKALDSLDIRLLLKDPGVPWEISNTGPDDSYCLRHIAHFLSANLGKSIEELQEEECVVLHWKNKQQLPASIEEGPLVPMLIYLPFIQIGLLCFSVQPKEEGLTLENYSQFIHRLRVLDRGIVYRIGDWSVAGYLEQLMGSLLVHTQRLSPPRLPVFTYVRLIEEPVPPSREWLLRLARVYSPSYKFSAQALHDESHVVETFDNIQFAAFIEGAAIMTIVPESSGIGFLREYGHQVARNRLMWSWLLAMIQHYSLVSAAEDIASYRVHGEVIANMPAMADPSGIAQLIRQLYHLQLKCNFTIVSHHSQQNQFYQLCRHALQVQPLLTDLKRGITDLNGLLVAEQQTREQQEKEVALAGENERSLRLNTTLGAVGIGISAAQISAGLEPNLFVAVLRWTELNTSVSHWPHEWLLFAKEVVVLSSNLTLGCLMGLLGKWLLLKIFIRPNRHYKK